MLKKFLGNVKLGIRIAQAKEKLKTEFLFSTHSYDNVPIMLSDLAVFANTGVENMPGAMVPFKQNVIIVNSFLQDLPDEFQEASLTHEVGHIKLGHTAKIQKISVDFEHEADMYAYNQGKDMLGTLEYMLDNYDYGPATKDLKIRVNMLKEACNAT